ncbi:MAG: SLBB domain-containing protein [Armatimonadota bacterium]
MLGRVCRVGFAIAILCVIASAGLAAAAGEIAPTPATPEAASAASTEAPATPATTPDQMTSSPAPPEEYRIQPGDSLTITVLGVPECSGTYTVRPDGAILLQDEMVGPIQVAGKTSAEATKAVSDRVAEYVKEPTLLLTINQFKVMVVGEVASPGQYDMTSGARLMDAITRAGGVKDELTNLPRVYVTKASGEQTRYDLRSFKERADASQNPLLEPGDRVSVGRPVSQSPARKAAEYKVTGAFAKPGTYTLVPDEPTRVSDAVRQAGRCTDEGDPRSAKLIRKDGTTLPLDLTLIDLDVSLPENVQLQDGDELFVPRNSVAVGVMGAVKTPGQYYVAPGTRVFDVILKAGGTTENALIERAAVVRSEPEPGRLSANLKRVTEQGDMAQNPVLQDRDIVFVPARETAGEKKSESPLRTISSFASMILPISYLLGRW